MNWQTPTLVILVALLALAIGYGVGYDEATVAAEQFQEPQPSVTCFVWAENNTPAYACFTFGDVDLQINPNSSATLNESTGIDWTTGGSDK